MMSNQMRKETIAVKAKGITKEGPGVKDISIKPLYYQYICVRTHTYIYVYIQSHALFLCALHIFIKIHKSVSSLVYLNQQTLLNFRQPTVLPSCIPYHVLEFTTAIRTCFQVIT